MIKSIIAYLYIKYPKIPFKKEPVAYEQLVYVLEDHGVNVIQVEENQIDKYAERDVIENFHSYLCYGEGITSSSSPFLIINKSKSWQIKWFAIAHEMGHFFLHGFFSNLLPSPTVVIGKERYNSVMGRVEMEADNFANLLLLPDSLLDGKFENEVRFALTKNDNEIDLQEIFKKIYSFCLDQSSEFLQINKFPPRAVLNLKIRAHRYISELREKLLLSYHDDRNPYQLSLKGKDPFPKDDPFLFFIRE